MSFCSTGCKSLDDMMNGGFPLKAPSLVFGIPNLGKTWLCFQTASNCTRDISKGGLGRPSLYLDTESFFTPDVFDRFYGYFQKRWTDLPKSPKIDVQMISDIFELGKEFGIQYEIIQEEARVSVLAKFPTDRQAKLAQGKGEVVKQTVQTYDWLTGSPIWKAMEAKNYGVIILDSITVPIKSVIPKGTQHLPGRGTLITSLLGTLYPIAKHFNAAIVITDHYSSNPMMGYGQGFGGSAWGGQDMMFYIKYHYGVAPALKDQREKFGPDAERLRRIERHRFPGLDKDIRLFLLMKDYGYTDVPTGSRPA